MFPSVMPTAAHASKCGNGYVSALASRLPDTVKLVPTRDAAAAIVATGSGCGARVEVVCTPINDSCALNGITTRIDRHRVERVIDDVPFNTWVLPTTHRFLYMSSRRRFPFLSRRIVL